MHPADPQPLVLLLPILCTVSASVGLPPCLMHLPHACLAPLQVRAAPFKVSELSKRITAAFEPTGSTAGVASKRESRLSTASSTDVSAAISRTTSGCMTQHDLVNTVNAALVGPLVQGLVVRGLGSQGFELLPKGAVVDVSNAMA